MRYLPTLTALMLVVGCATARVAPDPDTLDRVREAVFRFQIARLADDPGSNAIYFLSIENDRDPSASLLSSFAPAGFRVKPLSASRREFIDGGINPVWIERESGQIGQRLQVNELRFTSSDAATVRGFYGSVGSLFYVRRGPDGGWAVKREELNAII